MPKYTTVWRRQRRKKPYQQKQTKVNPNNGIIRQGLKRASIYVLKRGKKGEKKSSKN